MTDNRDIGEMTTKELLVLIYERQCVQVKCQEATNEHLTKLNGSVGKHETDLTIIKEKQSNVCQRVWKDIPTWIKMPMLVWLGATLFIMALGFDKLL